jgi:prepilin-type N-terminal cleavage/methylation domain-containing protein
MSVLLGVTRGVRSLLAMICTGHHACTKPSQAILPDAGGRTTTLSRRSAKLRSRSGFSLPELLIVVAIGMIAAVMTMPLFSTAVNQYRLRTSAVDLDGLLQRARTRAVRDNRTYTLQTAQLVQGGFTYTQVYLDLNGNQALDAGEPEIQFQRNVTTVTGGGIPAIPNASLGFTPQATNAQVNFNARGTPCVFVNGICSSWDSAGNAPNQVGFVYYLRAPLGSGNSWSAVSIAPSGRFRAWSYNSGVWSN